MKHLLNALNEFGGTDREHIEVDPKNHSVKFTIQDGPIKEVGLNGMQAVDILKFVRELFVSLDNDYPCVENDGTIQAINTALVFQDLRTRDRNNRNVEGKSLD